MALYENDLGSASFTTKLAWNLKICDKIVIKLVPPIFIVCCDLHCECYEYIGKANVIGVKV